jgi:hypothetical protein
MVFFVAEIQSKAQMAFLWQIDQMFVMPDFVPKMVFPEPTHLRFAVPVALPKVFPVLQGCQSFEMTLLLQEQTQLTSVKEKLNMVAGFLPHPLIRVACNMVSLLQETKSALLFVLLVRLIRHRYFRPF